MRASSWRGTLPESLTAAQPAIVQAVIDDNMRLPIEWCGIPITDGDNDAIIYLATDAMRVGEPGDSVRVDVSCNSQQQICDALGLQMPTPKMLDIVWAACNVRVKPMTFSPDAQNMVTVTDPATGSSKRVSMSSVTAMFAHDARISAAVGSNPGLVANIGKIWALIAKLGGASSQGGWVAANYGWYDKAANAGTSVSGAYRMWQGVGTRHNDAHVDYSQVHFVVHPTMLVNGEYIPTSQVMTSPSLCKLVCHDGPLPWARHPRLGPYPFSHYVAPDARDIPLVSAGVTVGGGGSTGTPTPTPGGGGAGTGPINVQNMPPVTEMGMLPTFGFDSLPNSKKFMAVLIGCALGWGIGKYLFHL